jgi:hypothetical protein
MKKLLLLGTALMVLATACSPTHATELDRNRSLWETQAIGHYSFDLNITCFCAIIGMMPLSIEVQDGQLVSINPADGTDISNLSGIYENVSTIDKLFETIEQAAGQDPATLNVSYDPTYGYPISIYLDPAASTADDEIGYDVSNFQALP